MEFDKIEGQYGVGDAGGVQTASFGGDKGASATFYRGRSPLEYDAAEAALAAGKPTFTEMDFIRITFAGNTQTVFDQPVNMVNSPTQPSHPKRFPRQWEAYQTGQLIAGGTPLSTWSALSPGDVKKFAGVNVHTVENLAEVSDGNLSGLGLGGREARDAARLHLLAIEAAKPQLVSDELAELRAQVAALTAAAKPKVEPKKLAA